MNIFVSYTLRDNEVGVDLLDVLSTHLAAIGNVYVDVLHNDSTDKQFRVISELKDSDLLVLIESKSVYESKWVNLELSIASEIGIPVIKFAPIEASLRPNTMMSIISRKVVNKLEPKLDMG